MQNNSAIRIFVTALETAINAYLRLDPDHEKQLSPLLGKTVGIALSSLRLTFYFTVTAGGIRVREQAPVPADAIIKTPSPLTLLQLIRSQHFSAETAIEGDSDVARRWQTLLRDIDIDWEEQLSRVFGDIAAHQFANAARASLSWGRNTAGTLLQNMSEYLQYEHYDLPARYAMESFLDAVDMLQADTERLAARVERLERICNNTSASAGVLAQGVSAETKN